MITIMVPFVIDVIFTITVTLIHWPLEDMAVKFVIFKLISGIDILSISCEIEMPQDLSDDQSTLGLVMAWYHQATSHYLNQCSPSHMTPDGTNCRKLL